MPTSHPRLTVAAATACLVLGCASTPAPAVSPEAPAVEGLVPFSLGQSVGLTPQVEATTRQGDSSLVYRVSEDGASIVTRFLGPAEAVGAPLGLRTEHAGDRHSLVGFVPGSDLRFTLATWRLDAAGRVADAHVRTEPFLEWRALGLEPGQLVTRVEWRPLVDGVGVGPWRR